MGQWILWITIDIHDMGYGYCGIQMDIDVATNIDLINIDMKMMGKPVCYGLLLTINQT